MLYPLIKFTGQCEEAMKFYHSCFGGELTLLSVAESPAAASFPVGMQSLIVQAELKSDKARLLGSDMSDHNITKPSGFVSLFVYCNSKHEIKSLYAKLSKGGKTIRSVALSFFGTLHGELQDKYGVNWILFQKKNNALI